MSVVLVFCLQLGPEAPVLKTAHGFLSNISPFCSVMSDFTGICFTVYFFCVPEVLLSLYIIYSCYFILCSFSYVSVLYASAMLVYSSSALLWFLNTWLFSWQPFLYICPEQELPNQISEHFKICILEVYTLFYSFSFNFQKKAMEAESTCLLWK